MLHRKELIILFCLGLLVGFIIGFIVGMYATLQVVMDLGGRLLGLNLSPDAMSELIAHYPMIKTMI